MAQGGGYAGLQFCRGDTLEQAAEGSGHEVRGIGRHEDVNGTVVALDPHPFHQGPGLVLDDIDGDPRGLVESLVELGVGIVVACRIEIDLTIRRCRQ